MILVLSLVEGITEQLENNFKEPETKDILIKIFAERQQIILSYDEYYFFYSRASEIIEMIPDDKHDFEVYFNAMLQRNNDRLSDEEFREQNAAAIMEMDM